MLLSGIRDMQPPMPDKAHWRGKAVGLAPGVRLSVTSATLVWAGVCRKSRPILTASLFSN